MSSPSSPTSAQMITPEPDNNKEDNGIQESGDVSNLNPCPMETDSQEVQPSVPSPHGIVDSLDTADKEVQRSVPSSPGIVDSLDIADREVQRSVPSPPRIVDSVDAADKELKPSVPSPPGIVVSVDAADKEVQSSVPSPPGIVDSDDAADKEVQPSVPLPPGIVDSVDAADKEVQSSVPSPPGIVDSVDAADKEVQPSVPSPPGIVDSVDAADKEVQSSVPSPPGIVDSVDAADKEVQPSVPSPPGIVDSVDAADKEVQSSVPSPPGIVDSVDAADKEVQSSVPSPPGIVDSVDAVDKEVQPSVPSPPGIVNSVDAADKEVQLSVSSPLGIVNSVDAADKEVQPSVLAPPGIVDSVDKEVQPSVPSPSETLDSVDAADKEVQPSVSSPPGIVDSVDAAVTDVVMATCNNKNVSEGENEDDAPRPVFRVAFRDVNVFQEYRQKIENFLKELILSECDKECIRSSTTDLLLEIFDANGFKKDSPDAGLKNWLKNKQSNDTLFTVDTEPKLQDDLDIPMYGKKFNKALQKPVKNVVETKVDYAPKMTCFNCLGNHSLRDCDQPKNYAAINKNRKDYNIKRGPTNLRYHLEDDQKYGHFVPGQISSNLRKALGIKENELPRHIYRMRVLGYPPGWLEEARLQHSGIALFNSDGQAEVGSDEEGEIVIPGDKDKYDIKKLIDFPGFNVLPPEGIREECKQYWGSAAQERSSKEAMLFVLSNKQADAGYKRRKLPNPANSRVSTDVNPGEMDIDEVEDTSVVCLPVKHLFIPPLPKDNNSDNPPPPPPPEIEDSDSQSQEEISPTSNGESSAPSSRDGSPSLFDLECAKKQLLAALNEAGSQSNPDSVKSGMPKSDSSNTLVPVLDSSKTEAPVSDTPKTDVSASDTSKVQESDSNKIDVNNVTPKSSPRIVSAVGSGLKRPRAVHLGTPILHSCSPFKRLPTSEKFSKDICDVINFENLPDATGKYDQMSELLQKVRQTVTELQKE